MFKNLARTSEVTKSSEAQIPINLAVVRKKIALPSENQRDHAVYRILLYE
jgi:hypothetical protein